MKPIRAGQGNIKKDLSNSRIEGQSAVRPEEVTDYNSNSPYLQRKDSVRQTSSMLHLQGSEVKLSLRSNKNDKGSALKMQLIPNEDQSPV